MKVRGRRKGAMAVPPFTTSVDAKVPGENIVLSHYMPEISRWLTVSEASDGRLFHGDGNTEPLARRVAGLRTWEHLKSRADGVATDLTDHEIEAARAELVREIENVRHAVETMNEAWSFSVPKEVVLVQLEAATKVAEAKTNKHTLAFWVLPPLAFLATGFANGVIGDYASKAVDLLTQLLSG